MHNLNPKYPLYGNVEQMIAPETLSEALCRTVDRVECRPMDGHAGLAGGQLSLLDTNAGRFVLKRMSAAFDWIMVATDDHMGRSVRLWEYGLLDRLRPEIDHAIVGCSHDGDGWAILMKELPGGCFTGRNLPPEYAAIFLDALARIHATFWNDSCLEDPRLGIADPAVAFNFYRRSVPYTGNSHGVIPQWVRTGWKVMEDLLDNTVYRQMVKLSEDPAPLLKAMSRYPYTLRHGDFRAENLAYSEKPIAIDWQQAARSLMTMDLAWCTNMLVYNGVSRRDAASYYRLCLERYLKRRFKDHDWQAMVDLGFAAQAVATTCFPAFLSTVADGRDHRAAFARQVEEQGHMVMRGLRWV